MNNPDNIFYSLETIFLFFLGLKYLNSLMRIRDPGWRQFGSGIRDGKKSHPGSGSATLLNSSTVEIINYGIFSSHWVRIHIPRTDLDLGQPKNADPDPLALGTDPAPDPSIIKQ